MRFFLKVAIICFCTAMGVVIVSDEAQACQAELCPRDDHFLPEQGAEVPANLKGLYYYHLFAPEVERDEEVTQMYLLDDGGEPVDEVAFEEDESDVSHYAFEFQFEDPLQPGETYRYLGETACSGEVGPVEELELVFHTADEAPIPEELGALEVVDTTTSSLQVSNSMSCSDDIRAAQAEVWLELSDDARPWESVLWYETLVDGEHWNASEQVGQDTPGGSSWVGRGQDLIYADCDGDDGLEEGTYSVQMRAYLPGVQGAIASDEVDVELECSTLGGRGCFCNATSSGGSPLSALIALLMVLGIARWNAASRRPDSPVG